MALGVRALSSVIIASCVLTIGAFAEDTDYDHIARPERDQLAKCFADILTVVERHSLPTYLASFLEAGCASEMRNVRSAVRVAKVRELAGLAPDVQGTILSTGIIARMEDSADALYREQKVSFCSDNDCPLNTYRKCLILQMQDRIEQRAEPRDFELFAQQKCKTAANVARSVLNVDFETAQKLQLSRVLSDKTRELIDEVITRIRHEAVISYAEDLTKVQPNRHSCKPEMCGDQACISLDPEPEPQYKCATGERILR